MCPKHLTDLKVQKACWHVWLLFASENLDFGAKVLSYSWISPVHWAGTVKHVAYPKHMLSFTEPKLVA